MLTLVICLVVVGGSIVAVLMITLGDDHQPATDTAATRREPGPAQEAQPPGDTRVRLLTISPWRRVRAAFGLLALTALVGLLVAGLVALALFAVALGLREAVGS